MYDFLKQAVGYIASAGKDPPALTALLVCLIVGFGGGWLLRWAIDAGTQSALEKSLAGIQQDYEQRLKGKDDLIEEYRRRLQIIAPKGGEIAQLTTQN